MTLTHAEPEEYDFISGRGLLVHAPASEVVR